jgi:hypothetical protein
MFSLIALNATTQVVLLLENLGFRNVLFKLDLQSSRAQFLERNQHTASQARNGCGRRQKDELPRTWHA